MIHECPHPWAGETVRINQKDHCDDREQIVPDAELVIEDWWDRVFGTDWQMTPHPLALRHMLRANRASLPLDDEVVYGKIDGMGVLVHVSEFASPPHEHPYSLMMHNLGHHMGLNHQGMTEHSWSEDWGRYSSSLPMATDIYRNARPLGVMWDETNYPESYIAHSVDMHFDHLHLAGDAYGYPMLPQVEMWNGERFWSVAWSEEDGIDALYRRERLYSDAFTRKSSGGLGSFIFRLAIALVVERSG